VKLRELDTTGVDAAKTQLELVEFQQNVAVKEIFLMAHLRTSCQRKVSPKFFPLLANSQWKFLRCLGLPAAAGGANCPLLEATINVKLGSPLRLCFSFSILLVISGFFALFRVFVGDLGFQYSHSHCDSPSFLRVFLSVASNPPTVGSGPFSAAFSLLA